jgi:hypothetical protein
MPCTSNWMDKFTVLIGPILLAIAEAKMLEAAEKHNVTDIMVPRRPCGGRNFVSMK